MVRRVGLVSLFGVLSFGIGCAPTPSCVDVELADATVDTTSGTPVIAWTGAAAEVTVTEAATEALAWDVRCNCAAEDDRPDTNAGCAPTLEEFEYRHCLVEPLTYGVLPEDPQLALSTEFDRTKSESDALQPGEDYDARVTAYCEGVEDGPNMIELVVRFIAP
jgi:hypothetical protein